MRGAKGVTHIIEKKNTFRLLIRQCEEKKSFGRHRCRRTNNTKMGAYEIG
jgi:hypothetical protein